MMSNIKDSEAFIVSADAVLYAASAVAYEIRDETLRQRTRFSYVSDVMEHTEPPPGVSTQPKLPWELHPALSEERLRICARLLANARRDALAMASYELGDDSWSVGCRAYAFGRHRLARAASTGQYNWLGVLDESNAFVFLIEDIPVRFYRGAADEPTARVLRRHTEEAEQLSLALGDAALGLVFRLAVETGEGGRVERVVFLALRGEEGEAVCVWPVPLEMPAAETQMPHTQLRLLPDDGYSGPQHGEAVSARARSGRAPAPKTRTIQQDELAIGGASPTRTHSP